MLLIETVKFFLFFRINSILVDFNLDDIIYTELQ